MKREQTLIGAHYAPRVHTFEKLMNPKHSGQFKSLRMMLAKKGPALRQPSPRRALHVFKQHSWFTAFHHVLFEYCQNFHYDMTGFAMQMQVRCFLRRSTHRFLVFVSQLQETGCWAKIPLQALVNRFHHGFSVSLSHMSIGNCFKHHAADVFLFFVFLPVMSKY